jgi:hypothetical protein
MGKKIKISLREAREGRKLRKINPADFRAFDIPGTFSFFGVVSDFSVFLTEKCRKYAFSNFQDPSEI